MTRRNYSANLSISKPSMNRLLHIFLCLFCRSVSLLCLLLHHHLSFVYFPASLHLRTAALESKINTMWSVASRLLSFPLIVTYTSLKVV